MSIAGIPEYECDFCGCEFYYETIIGENEEPLYCPHCGSVNCVELRE